MNGCLMTSYKVYQQSAKRSIQTNSLFCTQTRSQLRYSAIGSKAKWRLSTTFRSQNSKVVSAKKDAVSTSLAWAKRLVLNVTPTLFKPISLTQTAYFPPENRISSLLVNIADSEITLKRTATNALPKSTMRRRPANLRKMAVAVLAEGEKGGRGGRGSRGGRGGGNNTQGANLVDGNAANAPAYSAIFGGLAFCLKAATNGHMRQVNGTWVKDNSATHHMHYDKSLFIDYHSLKHRLYVSGIGSRLKAVGVGDIEIKDPNGNIRILKGVLHVPKLKCGL